MEDARANAWTTDSLKAAIDTYFGQRNMCVQTSLAQAIRADYYSNGPDCGSMYYVFDTNNRLHYELLSSPYNARYINNNVQLFAPGVTVACIMEPHKEWPPDISISKGVWKGGAPWKVDTPDGPKEGGEL